MAVPPLPPKKTLQAALAAPSAPAAAPPARLVKMRRSKTLQPWMIEPFAKALANAPVKFAADIIGVSERTALRWLAEADDEGCTDELLLSFAAAANAARAGTVGNLLDVWRTAASMGDWRASKDLLAVLDPERFNPARKVEMKAEVTAVAEKEDLSIYTPEERAFLEQMELKKLAAKALPA